MIPRTIARSKAQDLGDFQTPTIFTDRICKFLANRGHNPSILLEPTVGVGNFVFSASKSFPKLRYIYAVDIQEDYTTTLAAKYREIIERDAPGARLEVHRDNILTHVFSPDFLAQVQDPETEFLILGNPPWITNAELSRLASDNVPRKSNLKNAKGLDALTGKANFDIAESIVLRLLEQFSSYKCHIALLLKMTVIRNLIRDLTRFGFRVSAATAFTFDTKKEFGIAASAAIFVATLGDHTEFTCATEPFGDTSNSTPKRFGYVEKRFVSDIDTYATVQHLDGTCPFTWRQGIKHDAAAVMLVTPVAGTTYINGISEQVELEDTLLFPFAKGSDIANAPVIRDLPQRVIIPQSKLGEDTDTIASKYPKLWQYLLDHGPALDARKSSMYRGKPRFSIFGVGPYAFLPYKVTIASFYKEPTFSLVLPIAQKPVMFDDTSYLLGFNALVPALFTWVILNQPQIRDFLRSIAFIDTKRPYTKEILMRVNLAKFLASIDYKTMKVLYSQDFQSQFDYSFSKAEFLAFKASVIPTF